MPFQIHIENYQSIEVADLEISGLTVITGQNNSGKSAIMRAFRAPYHNPGGRSFIRNGKNHTRVRITYEDGHTIMWEKIGRRSQKGKTKGELIDIKTNYEIDGVRYDGVGTSVPEEVFEHAVRPISVGGKDIWPQFARQVRDVYFLVDQPGYNVAEAVSDVDRVSILTHATRSCDKDLRSCTSELKVRRQDEKDYKQKIESLQGLDVVLEQVDSLEDKQKLVERINKGLTLTRGFRDRLQAAEQDVKALSPVEKIRVPSDTDNLTSLVEKLSEARRLQGRLNEANAQVTSLKSIDSVRLPEASLASELHKVLGDLTEAKKLRTRLQEAQSEVSALASVEGVQKLDLGASLVTLKKLVKGIEMVTGLQSRLAQSQNEIEDLETQRQEHTKAYGEASQEMTEFEDEYPRCPECGQFRSAS